MLQAVIAQAGGTGAGGGILGFLPFILILVIIYFLMLRPQMKRQKEHASMLGALQKNDDIITSGGVHGRIIRINERDNSVQIMVSRGVVITVERSSVARKKQASAKDVDLPKEGSKPRNNSQKQDNKSQDSAKNDGKSGGKSFDQPSLESNTAMVTTGVDPKAESRKPRGRRNPRRYNRKRPQNKDNKQQQSGQSGSSN